METPIEKNSLKAMQKDTQVLSFGYLLYLEISTENCIICHACNTD